MPSYSVRVEGADGSSGEFDVVFAPNPALACVQAKARWGKENPNEPLIDWEVMWSSSPKPPSYVIEPRYE